MIKRVGLGLRSGALLLDFFFVILLSFILVLFGFSIHGLLIRFGIMSGFSIDTSGDAWAAVLFILYFNGLFYNIFEIFTGTSLGKMALGLKIGKKDGQKGNIRIYFLRYLLKNSIFLFFLGFGIIEDSFLIYLFLGIAVIVFLGYFLLLGPQKQALHDRLSGIAVFRKADIKN